MPKSKITAEEWDLIEKKSSAARLILENPRYAFIMEYIAQAKKEIENMILNNTVREVLEEYTVADNLKRIFKITKKVQIDELSGQYKFIDQFIDFLQKTANLKEKAEEMENKNQLVIERGNERSV